MEEMTRVAESRGFDSVWIPEAWGRDTFTLLALLAVRTTTIKLATGIVNVFSRTPAITAQSIASLDDISGGRAILGLGASGPRVIEQWHGLRFENVLRRTREYVDVVRLILSGARVDYEGQIFKLRGFSLGFQPPRKAIPIYLAAIGPANTRLAGEVADGWLPIFVSPSILRAAEPWLTEGAVSGHRSRSDVTVASYVPTLLGGADACERLRGHIAFYVGGMGSYYFRLMIRSGWREEAETIRRLWTSGSRSQAAAAVSDDMIRQLAITGSPEAGRQRLSELRALGVELPVLTIPEGSPPEAIRATLEALGGG